MYLIVLLLLQVSVELLNNLNSAPFDERLHRTPKCLTIETDWRSIVKEGGLNRGSYGFRRRIDHTYFCWTALVQCIFPMRACLTGVVYCICRERVVKLFVHRKNLFNGGIRFTFFVIMKRPYACGQFHSLL